MSDDFNAIEGFAFCEFGISRVVWGLEKIGDFSRVLVE